LSDGRVCTLARPVLDSEIQDTLFSLAKGKAPGPDGFTVEFFKSNWGIARPLVLEEVRDFFSSGRLLREVNNTILTLVPKVPNSCAIFNFRPIACCNTIYKVITKILANHLAVVLSDLINPSQNAFVNGRRIRDNILVAQELFAGFHLDPYLAKCVINVDFQKAYDLLIGISYSLLFRLLAFLIGYLGSLLFVYALRNILFRSMVSFMGSS